MEVTNKQMMAQFRQNWIGELRDILAELTGKHVYYWASGHDDLGDPELLHIDELMAKLELYINPDKPDHVELLKSIQAMNKANSGSRAAADKKFWTAHPAVVKLSQLVLKREWDRLKNDME